MKNELREVMDTRLSALQWDQAKSQEILRKTRGDFKVKKKLRLSAVIVMALVLLTATAFALYALQLSPKADAVSQARRALTEKYGLTPEAFGLFYATSSQEGQNWVVHFAAGEGIYPALIGEYTVTLEKGRATASWSHDDVDPALWQSGPGLSPGASSRSENLRAIQAQDIQARLWRSIPAPQPTPEGSLARPDLLGASGSRPPPRPPKPFPWTGRWAWQVGFGPEYGLPRNPGKRRLVDGRYFLLFPIPKAPPCGFSSCIWCTTVEWGCGVIRGQNRNPQRGFHHRETGEKRSQEPP